MPSSYLIDPENRVVRCRAWGVLTHPEAVTTREQFTNDPAFSADFSQIYDLNEVERIDMTGDQIRSLAGFSSFAPHTRRAAVASQTAIYGAMRMFAIQHQAGGGNTQINVFKSIGEAEAWLGIPSGTLTST
jgi:hypothetical protein